ncbi:MAG TPA: hypothetical protein VMS31_00985 [Pyrinomonadaceae bacterium]|nr:hypothetical protein [Pyrinomonadaceae bacterium]
MLKTHLSQSKLVLSLLVLLCAFAQPLAAQQKAQQTMPLEQVKIKIARLGIGEKAKATVKLMDGSKTKGYIAQASDEEFVLRDRKTNAPTTIRYADVAKVESNRGHSTARNIALGIGIGAGAFVAIIFITIAHLD